MSGQRCSKNFSEPSSSQFKQHCINNGQKHGLRKSLFLIGSPSRNHSEQFLIWRNRTAKNSQMEFLHMKRKFWNTSHELGVLQDIENCINESQLISRVVEERITGLKMCRIRKKWKERVKTKNVREKKRENKTKRWWGQWRFNCIRRHDEFLAEKCISWEYVRQAGNSGRNLPFVVYCPRILPLHWTKFAV